MKMKQFDISSMMVSNYVGQAKSKQQFDTVPDDR